MKRIMIFGIPGSGKSRFGVKIGRLLNLPVFHLDRYFFIDGWKEYNPEEFLKIQKELVEREHWVIDGNATRSLEIRFARADTVLYFRFNRLLCFRRILKRRLWKDPSVSDRAEGCPERVTFRLIRYLFGFPKRVNRSVEELRKKYPEAQFYEFRSDREAGAFLRSLKTGSKYVYKPYSGTYPELFREEKGRIGPGLKNVLAIEHIGSTAVPGLGGKGIIDIAIVVPGREIAYTCDVLQTLGYEFRPSFSTPDRRYLIAYLPDKEEGTRRYHIHVTRPDNPELQGFIRFRDYLRNHKESTEEYAEIKKQAIQKAKGNGEGYRKGKEPFFRKINSFIENGQSRQLDSESPA